MKYNNSKLRTMTAEGNTISDKAIAMWTAMNPWERAEIMDKVADFKRIAYKQRACINYIVDHILT